jgi:Protein of unknown function (DUF3604)
MAGVHMMRFNETKRVLLTSACVLALVACAKKEAAPVVVAPVAASTATAPAVDISNNPLKEAYFGEQHLHTRYSLDAFLGGEALTPDEA